ncbi:MAG: YafY family protein [Bacteroidota bacterium]
MNRIDRVTAMLIQLQSRRVVKAQDLADRFTVSLRTIYRDIRTLEEAGVPIVGEAGIGYSLMEGYRLPPVMFTLEEATAFLTAEKLIEKMTDDAVAESYRSALYKVKAVLKTTEKDYLEKIDQHIEVLNNPYLPVNNKTTNHIPIILRSITDQSVLSIQYFANHSQQETERHVEPLGIFYSFNHWHLIGYCQLRNDYRDFRLDRIRNIFRTNKSYSKTHPPLQNFLKTLAKEKEVHEVVIDVPRDIMKYFGEQKYYNGFISEKEFTDHCEMIFLTGSLEGFSRWYMMFGDRGHILSPPELKVMVRTHLENLQKNLK